MRRPRLVWHLTLLPLYVLHVLPLRIHCRSAVSPPQLLPRSSCLLPLFFCHESLSTAARLPPSLPQLPGGNHQAGAHPGCCRPLHLAPHAAGALGGSPFQAACTGAAVCCCAADGCVGKLLGAACMAEASAAAEPSCHVCSGSMPGGDACVMNNTPAIDSKTPCPAGVALMPALSVDLPHPTPPRHSAPKPT